MGRLNVSSSSYMILADSLGMGVNVSIMLNRVLTGILSHVSSGNPLVNYWIV